MNRTSIICCAVLIELALLSCKDQGNKQPQNISEVVSDTSKIIPKQVFNINKDSLATFTPGENGVELPVVVKAGKPLIRQVANLPVIPGESYLIQPKEDTEDGKKPVLSKKPERVLFKQESIRKFIPGKGDMKLPKVYKIYQTNSPELVKDSYTLQNGDTIYPPSTKIYPYPKESQALLPVYKDRATKNIQYLSLDEGLPYPDVNALMQDKRGYIWIATNMGLSRYDGKVFTHFTSEYGLDIVLVTSLFEDKTGKIWFGTNGYGVYCYNGQSFTQYTTKQGLNSDVIISITEDSNGRLWFGTGGGGVSCYNGNSFTNYANEQGLLNNTVLSLYKDKNGKIWMGCCCDVLSCFDGVSFTNYTPEYGLMKGNVLSITQDKKGRLWFATGFGISCLDGDSFTNFTSEQGLWPGYLKSIIEDKNGNLWIGSSEGITRYDGNSFTYITTDDGLSNGDIKSIIEDKSRRIWFGTVGGGVNILDDKSFNHLNLEKNFNDYKTDNIIEDKSGKMWFAFRGYGMCSFDGKSIAAYATIQGLAGNYVTSIVEDNIGNLWFGTLGGGVSCFDGKFFKNYTIKQGLSSNRIWNIFKDKNGNLWFLTEGAGICSFDGKSFTHYSYKEGFIDAAYFAVCEDRKGRFWFGSFEHGISCLEGNTLTRYKANLGSGIDWVSSVHEDHKGNLLIGTLGGITYYNGQSFNQISTKNGLSNNVVSTILEDQDQNLWIGSFNGLNFIPAYDSLGKKANNLINENTFLSSFIFNFGKLDGLKGVDCWGASAYLDSKNRYWFATERTISMLDLNQFKLPELKPDIQLTSVEIKENFIDFRLLKKGDTIDQSFKDLVFDSVEQFYNYPLNLKLPFNLNHLTFHFSAIDWQAPHKLQYQYKLEGLEKKWSQLTSENKADYRNIPYGTFTFKVKAIGAAKKWSETFEYSFTVHPPWWQTWLARMFYIIIIIVLIWLIVKWRTAKLKQEKSILEEKVKERTLEIKNKNEELIQQNEEIQTINTALSEQKNLIEEKNSELEAQNEEIQTINNSLNEKSNLIEEKNTELESQNEEITTQRDILSSQNKAINESILYAKRIQTAVLPQQAYIDEILPENFILYKPRNVVSGDFYWVKQMNKIIIMVAADCTGHGVPGAIMSMLGISFLNEIVQKREITQANQVLNELRKQLKQALKQTGRKGGIDDGMDIALCALDTKTNMLQYAGANNPIYLIQNNELTEIQSDRMPIGFYPNEKPSFTNNEIQLNASDIFYLFSDGFTDQFGGEKGFKYKAANFQKILLQNHNKPMEIQKELLEQELNTWMKGYEQTDDILVMGVRV